MRNRTAHLRVSVIELTGPLPAPQRRSLVSRLLEERGIAGADLPSDSSRLVVEYDADQLASGDLVDCLSSCGVGVREMRVGYL